MAAPSEDRFFLVGVNLPPENECDTEQRFECGSPVPVDIDTAHLSALEEMGAVSIPGVEYHKVEINGLECMAPVELPEEQADLTPEPSLDQEDARPLVVVEAEPEIETAGHTDSEAPENTETEISPEPSDGAVDLYTPAETNPSPVEVPIAAHEE